MVHYSSASGLPSQTDMSHTQVRVLRLVESGSLCGLMVRALASEWPKGAFESYARFAIPVGCNNSYDTRSV